MVDKLVTALAEGARVAPATGWNANDIKAIVIAATTTPAPPTRIRELLDLNFRKRRISMLSASGTPPLIAQTVEMPFLHIIEGIRAQFIKR